MEKIRVIISESNVFFRTSIINTIKKYKDIEIIGEAGNGIEALNKVKKSVPDVLLMEAKIDCQEIICTAQLSKEFFPGMKILAITFSKNQGIVNKILKAGVDGLIFKDSSVKEISNAIIKIKEGQMYFPKEFINRS